jgi:hypothetical protein
MPTREFLRVIKESALGTVMTSPVAGTDSIYIRLHDGNNFTPAVEPVMEKIMWGGGLATTGEIISDHYNVSGTLKTKLYPAQDNLLLNWAIATINTGQTTPWTTTEPAGDLASCSIYHAIMFSNGTYRRKRYSGAKVKSWRIEVNRQGTSATLTLEVTACRAYGATSPMDTTSDPDATEFPAPADSDYPTGPYTFKMTSGGLKLGTTRSAYESLVIAGQNVLDTRHFETSYAQLNTFLGRQASLEADLLFKASPDNRAAYEALTAQDAELTFDTGTNTCKIDFNTKAKITKLANDLPIDKAFMEKLTLENVYDASTGNDIAVSFT